MDIRIVTLAIALGVTLPIYAQLADQTSSQEPQALPEEIQILGDRSILQLRTQMMEAEKKAYDIFNKYNDEKRFNILCDTRQPTGTRINRQVCQAGFELQATRTHAQAYYENTRETLNAMAGCATSGSGCQPPSFSHPVLYAPVETVIASQQLEYKKKIKEVAEEHPEFLNAIIEFGEMRQRYEAATSTGR